MVARVAALAQRTARVVVHGEAVVAAETAHQARALDVVAQPLTRRDAVGVASRAHQFDAELIHAPALAVVALHVLEFALNANNNASIRHSFSSTSNS